MDNDTDITSGSVQPVGRVVPDGTVQSVSASVSHDGAVVESSVISASVTSVGTRERNRMFMITGCSGLFLTNVMALTELFWSFYNVSNSLPHVHLPDWMVGFIFSTYGSAVVVWVQNKVEKAVAARKA